MTAAPITILAPTGMLGYGYPEQDFWAWIRSGVDAVVVDSGSTDPGPYLLGLGSLLVTEDSYERDLRPMLRAAHEYGVPVYIGSAGGAGTRDQVERIAAVVDRVCAAEGFRLRVATIDAEVPADLALRRLAEGRFDADVRGELPTEADVRGSAALVAQMGAGPFTSVIEGDEPVDVVVAGRAYDPAPHAAFAMSRGVEPGIAWHAGKILECGGYCCEPKDGGVAARLHPDAFELTPMSPGQRCTPLSVAAHTLYEKQRPDRLPGPDGVLDTSGCTFTAVDERTVRVRGSRHHEGDRPTLKVEGAAPVGYRSVFVGGVRDPILIDGLDEFLDRVAAQTRVLQPALADDGAELVFHVYGRDAVLGRLEPDQATPHEVGIVGEVTAVTQELATAICTTARVNALHMSYPGQKATAGNLAFPLSPMDIPIGPVCRFTVYHVMDATGTDLFGIEYREAGA